MFAGLGQDDVIGGSSSLYGLTTPAAAAGRLGHPLRRGGHRIDRNALGKGADSTTGQVADHGFDADYILGDNGNLYRLVSAAGPFLTFNYDTTADIGSDASNPGAPQTRGPRRVIPRAFTLLDYVPGNDADARVIGASDLVHAEDGDDVVHGQRGNDVLYGDAWDDDIYGGTGSDKIFGGTGEDGILGDDGMIKTAATAWPSRSTASPPRPRTRSASTAGATTPRPGSSSPACSKKTVDVTVTYGSRG